MRNRNKRNLIIIIAIPMVLLFLLYQNFYRQPSSIDNLSLAKKFLDTKTTGSNNLICGPPDDWDCGYSRYQYYAIAANLQYYEKTGDSKYLQYATNFANTMPASAPEVCPNCICGMPDDFDCGNGEDQWETIYGFARLYEVTNNKTYLDFAEKVAATKPSNPPAWCDNCVCGPDKDWDCGHGAVQLGFYKAYEILYKLTGNIKYQSYMENLLNNFEDKTAMDRGIDSIIIYSYAAESTGNSRYLDIAKQKAIDLSSSNFPCGPPDKWQCPPQYKYYQAKLISLYSGIYKLTGDQQFLDNGSVDCGPNNDWVCSDPFLQAMMASAYYNTYKLTSDEKYLNYFNNLISNDALEKLNCSNFDCHDAEFNYYFAISMVNLK